MQGAEILSATLLGDIWSDMGTALTAEAKGYKDGVQGYLKKHSSVWNVVGRVCFHLAENKRDPEFPFAFIATYVHKVSKQAKPQHLPLGRALKDYAGTKNRQKLLALLAPLSRAAEQSAFIRELVDTGDIYHPLSWSPKEAHRFLCEIALYEQAGLVEKMLSDADLMKQMLVADGARAKREGRSLGPAQYGPAMKIYTDIQKASKKAATGVLQRLALAIALEHAVPIAQANPEAQTEAPDTIDPVKRYLHYEKAYLDGELDPAFERLSEFGDDTFPFPVDQPLTNFEAKYRIEGRRRLRASWRRRPGVDWRRA